MNKFRRLVPGFVLGLTIALAGVSFAQNATQSGAGKKMDSCCGDSCPMMKDGATKNHAASTDKHECCCCGDSCSMKKDGAMKNHAASSDKGECCCGDSCATMKQDGAKSGAASDKHECCGDSCNMKEMKDMKKS
jgi:hypothetical protein